LAAAREEISQLRHQSCRRSHASGEMLDVVAHELRSPLTVIAGYVRLLSSVQAGEIEGDSAEYLRELAAACTRLDTFVGLLLGAEAGDVGPYLVEAPLVAAVSAAVEPLRSAAAEAGARVSLQFAEDTGHARFAPSALESILRNLVGNALRYGGPEVEVVLSTRPCTLASGLPGVEVAVEDSGRGLDPGCEEQLFEPYWRGRGVRSDGAAGRGGARSEAPRPAEPEGLLRSPGLGLGLAISRRLAVAQGGELHFERNPVGPGCRFVFTLRAAEPKDRAGDEPEGAPD